MRQTRPHYLRVSLSQLTANQLSSSRPPLIRISNGTFYRRQPSPAPSGEETASNPPLFANLDFEFPADDAQSKYCAIVGPSNAGKTTFLEILRGAHLCFPPTARTYPYLNSEELLQKDKSLSWPARAIQYVGFSGQHSGPGSSGSYLSARYESRRESDDFSLLDFLLGKTQLNALNEEGRSYDDKLLSKVIEDLRLGSLVDMPLRNLSNGQTRRARIAKALLGQPELLLLDEPFMGLDPPTTAQLNPILRELAYSSSPRLLLALRPQDPIPDWVTSVLYLGNTTHITHQGSARDVTMALRKELSELTSTHLVEDLAELPRYHNEFGRILSDDGVMVQPEDIRNPNVRRKFSEAKKLYDQGERSDEIKRDLGLGELIKKGSSRNDYIKYGLIAEPPLGEPLIEMEGVTVRYGDKAVLGNWNRQYEMAAPSGVDGEVSQATTASLVRFPSSGVLGAKPPGLHWTVRRGQRWAIIGPNGSGKTTLLSLITSDHPQAYALPLKLFGRSRLPTPGQPGQPGLSLFDIQKRIGHASPEVHHFFPKQLSVRATLESAYAETPLSPPKLDAEADARISACLRWFQGDLNPAIGPDPLLHREALRTQERQRKEYVAPGDSEIYMQERAEWFYKIDVQNEDAITWADDMRFSEMTLSGQRVALFLRATVAQPDIVILDEAFSGMDDVVRDKCLLFLEAGERRRQSPFRRQKLGRLSKTGLAWEERYYKDFEKTGIAIEKTLLAPHQALLVVSHVREEIPRGVTRWLYLPEGGGQGMGASREGPVFATGQIREMLMGYDPRLWNDIWSIPMLPRREATLEELEAKMALPETSAGEPATDRKDLDSAASGEAEGAQRTNKKHPGRRKGTKGITYSKKTRIPMRYAAYVRPGEETSEDKENST